MRMLNGDILSFARHYKGPLFHALICDPPYHLTSIVKRFGKKDSVPAKDTDGVYKRAGSGFMGKSWDGGDIAFRPETWALIGELLLPGAFCIAFGGSRTAHRMAVAIEDAGFIIHPMMGWVYGSGFPKATNISKQIDKQAGVETAKGNIRTDGRGIDQTRIDNHQPGMSGIGHADGSKKTYIEELATTDLAKAWEGHRYGAQALKPALEPIIVFQKPYDGKPMDNITMTGAGALNIDSGRIGKSAGDRQKYGREKELDDMAESNSLGKYNKNSTYVPDSSGRWPANIILQHLPECSPIGSKEDDYTINRFTEGAKPFGDAVGEEFDTEEIINKSVVWECVKGCPISELDNQTGETISRKGKPRGTYKKGMFANSKFNKVGTEHNDSGGASRFFYQTHHELEKAFPIKYQAKAAKKEKNAGLDSLADKMHGFSGGARSTIAKGKEEYTEGQDIGLNRVQKVKNPHPTIKPLDLVKYLAKLLLPPDKYAPRRILIPFAGTGSEMIGAYMAGWDEIIGIEKESEYVEIAKLRIQHWKNTVESSSNQLHLF